MIRIKGILYLNPNFLIDKEQIDIVQKACDVGFVACVVSTTTNDDCVAYWQKTHSVIRTSTRWLTRALYILEFASDHLMVDCFGLEVPYLIFDQLAIGGSTSEVVDSFLNFVTLKFINKLNNLPFSE